MILRTQIFEVDTNLNQTYSNYNEPELTILYLEPNRTIQFKYQTLTELHKKYKVFKLI